MSPQEPPKKVPRKSNNREKTGRKNMQNRGPCDIYHDHDTLPWHPLKAWADPAAVRLSGWDGRRLLDCFSSFDPFFVLLQGTYLISLITYKSKQNK